MKFSYTLHIKESPDLSYPHFALSVPEEYSIVKALIYDLGRTFGKSVNEIVPAGQVQADVMECIDRVLVGKSASDVYIEQERRLGRSDYAIEIFQDGRGQNDEYWTQSYTMRVITEGDDVLFFITSRSSHTRYTPCTIYAKDLKELLQLWMDAPKLFMADPIHYKDEFKKRTNVLEETMVVLESVERPGDVLCRVSSRADGLWQIEVGPWEKFGVPHHPFISHLTKEEILMNADDVRGMAREIQKVLTDKRVITPIDDEVLPLTFRQNEPKLKIALYFVNSGYPLFNLVVPETVLFRPSTNINFIKRPYGPDEEESLFSGEGASGTSNIDLPPGKLKKFADRLKETVGKDSKWREWKSYLKKNLRPNYKKYFPTNDEPNPALPDTSKNADPSADGEMYADLFRKEIAFDLQKIIDKGWATKELYHETKTDIEALLKIYADNKFGEKTNGKYGQIIFVKKLDGTTVLAPCGPEHTLPHPFLSKGENVMAAGTIEPDPEIPGGLIVRNELEYFIFHIKELELFANELRAIGYAVKIEEALQNG